MNLLNFEVRDNLMNADSKTCVAQDARPQCSPCDGASNDISCDSMPPSNPTRVKRLTTSDEIERALHIAPTRPDGTLRLAVVALGALVGMCLVMAAIVWWRLLT